MRTEPFITELAVATKPSTRIQASSPSLEWAQAFSEVVSRVSRAESIDDLGLRVQRSVQELLDKSGRRASVIVGLRDDDNKLKTWSLLPPGRVSMELEETETPLADVLVRLYGLHSNSVVSKFSIDWDLCKKGAVVIACEEHIEPALVYFVEALCDVSSTTGYSIKLRKKLARSDAVRSRLIDQLATASDEDRDLVAGDLHDGPLQTLSAVVYHPQLSKRKATEKEVSDTIEILDKVERLLKEEIGRLRSLMAGLDPPAMSSSKSLVQALEEYLCESMLVHPDISIAIEMPENDVRLPEEIARIMYRVAQEALANVVKHARASIIKVSTKN